MDIIAFILSAENVRTLVLFVTMLGGFFWLERRMDQKIAASEARQDQKIAALRQEMNTLGAALRQEMNALGAALRQEMGALDQKIDALASSLRQEMDGLASSLRQEIEALNIKIDRQDRKIDEQSALLRQEMDDRFFAFHKALKENDFAHLNRTIEALTFMLQKNKMLEPEDKKYVDSHLEDK
jgi:DNA anti-recombination protein RmuC